jgi:hypothetical protein
MIRLTIEDIRAALARPLPGVAAQVRLAPLHRIEQLYQAPPADARPAGVLIAKSRCRAARRKNVSRCSTPRYVRRARKLA